MPWEYQKSDALYTEWHEFHGDIEMYFCSSAYDIEERCYIITDKEEIRFVLSEYMKAVNITHSRKEVEEANFPSDWGARYTIEISILDSIDDDGNRDIEKNLFVDFINEDTTLSNSYKGVYYYYNLSEELHNFVINYDNQN